ncbi:hypothetical protein BH10BDE1_BH10BDE1_25500 [soil metagenome]
MARSFVFLFPIVTLMLAACGKFAADPTARGISAAADPLKAEREDMIKLAVQKEVPKEVAQLFSKERRQSDASLVNPLLLAGSSDPRLLASVASIDRMNSGLLKRRFEMLRIQELMVNGRPLSHDESAWIRALSNEFKAIAGSIEDLRRRVDVWPASFLLSSVLVAGKSWPNEVELSDRMTVLNTSNKAEIAAVRVLRARLQGDDTKPDVEKSRALVEELTKTLAPSVKAEMLKTVLDVSKALQEKSLGETP